MQYFLAVDIGASSGRHVIGWEENKRIYTQEVYRFENEPVNQNGTMCWQGDYLWEQILTGMQACAKTGKLPATMGIDTWGVDFVLLDEEKRRLGEMVCYRDGRTSGMDTEVEKIIPFTELYEKTGIQKQSFNTVYQLMALKKKQPELLEKAKYMLMVPEYFNFCLTGEMKREYTNATSTGLVNAQNKTWDFEVIEQLGYPTCLFTDIEQPGIVVGVLLPEIAKKVGFACKVLLPPSHDTASAFLAVPSFGKDAAFLSSGTWSLLGMEREQPVITEAGRQANFTNEGGYNGRFRFLKNIMGLWMIQSVRKELAVQTSFQQLEAAAKREMEFPSVINVNDSRFLKPENMAEEITKACAESGQAVPSNTGQVVQCIYRSLAKEYEQAIAQLEIITGRTVNTLHIVGGGSKDAYLAQLTAKATGLAVYTGPIEATVLGNLASQMIAAGEFAGVEEVRRAIQQSFAVKQYNP